MAQYQKVVAERMKTTVELKGEFYCWAVMEYGSEECRCTKQCKACTMKDKQ